MFCLFSTFADPRTKNWILVESPGMVLLIVFSYLYIVKKIGPEFMKNRKPYNVELPMIVYNIVQVLLSSFIVLEVGSFNNSKFVTRSRKPYLKSENQKHDCGSIISKLGFWLILVVKRA